MLTALASFDSAADTFSVLQQNPDLDGGIGSLAGLAPFLEDTDLETILENLPEDQILSDELVGIAPFLSDKLVSRLGRRALIGKNGLFRALLPFMDDSESLRRLAGLQRGWWNSHRPLCLCAFQDIFGPIV